VQREHGFSFFNLNITKLYNSSNRCRGRFQTWPLPFFPSERRYRAKREKPVTMSREEMTTKKNFAWKAIP